MAPFFLFLLIGLISFFLIRGSIGAILCLLVAFPDLFGIIFVNNGIEGMSTLTRFFLYAVIAIMSFKVIDSDYINLVKNPLSLFFFLFALVFYLHNVVITKAIYTNPQIATFQLDFFIKIVIPFTLLMITAKRREVLIDFCKSIPVWGALFILVFFLLVGIEGVDFGDRMTLESEMGINSIYLSRIAVIIALPSFLCSLQKTLVWRYLYLLLFATSLFLLFLAGQRGTIIGAAISILFFFGLVYIRQGRVASFAVLLFAISVVSYAILSSIDFEVLHRFSELENYESFQRFEDFGRSWDAFKGNNYVLGLGSMGYHHYTHGLRPYPHNFVLELMVEYGIIGLLFSLTVVFYGIYMSYKVVTRNVDDVNDALFTVPLVWLSLLVSVLVSGSLISNSVFLLYTAILVLEYENTKTMSCGEEEQRTIM